jgi:hypothetical protein
MAALCAKVWDAKNAAACITPYASGKSRVDTVLGFGGRRRQQSRLWYWTLSAMMSFDEGYRGQF